MSNSAYVFEKQNKNDKIWWVNNPNQIGVWLFSFDKEKVYNMFADYPHNLSRAEKEIFDRENPYWKEFFSDRQ